MIGALMASTSGRIPSTNRTLSFAASGTTKIWQVARRVRVVYITLPAHCGNLASKVNLSMNRLRRVTISLNTAISLAYNWTASFQQGLLEKTPGGNGDCLWLPKEALKKSLHSHKRDDDWPPQVRPVKKAGSACEMKWPKADSVEVHSCYSFASSIQDCEIWVSGWLNA